MKLCRPFLTECFELLENVQWITQQNCKVNSFLRKAVKNKCCLFRCFNNRASDVGIVSRSDTRKSPDALFSSMRLLKIFLPGKGTDSEGRDREFCEPFPVFKWYQLVEYASIWVSNGRPTNRACYKLFDSGNAY